MRTINQTTALAAMLLALTLIGEQSADAGKRYALVVGVKSYRPGQPLPKLSYTENDATEFAKVLEDGGYDVTLMTQAVGRVEGKEVYAPISDYIRDQAKALLQNPFLKDDDVVLVALVGHGVQYNLIDGDGAKTPKFYFCPADADVRSIKSVADITASNRLIDLGEFYDSLQTCGAGGKLLLVDACRNDPSKPAVARALTSSTLPALPPPLGGTAAFFSCSPNQQAFEDADLQHGVFFHHVIEAFRGQADSSTAARAADGQITLAELSEHVSASTYDFVRRKYNGARQAPELKGQFRLSIPLIDVSRGSVLDPSLTNPVGMKFVRIEPGAFTMGSPLYVAQAASQDDLNSAVEMFGGEFLQHEVTISKPIYAGKFEVTVGEILQWLNTPGVTLDVGWMKDAADESTPRARLVNRFSSSVEKSGDRWVLNRLSKFGQSEQQPMQSISWLGAVAYCRWMSEADPNFTYRLPTEAEWEFMARAGSSTEYPWGDVLNGRDANVDGTRPFGTTEQGPCEAVTTKVGSYKPNLWGLHDMIGNVGEWCADWYSSDCYRQKDGTDPTGPPTGYSRVFRGGSWRDDAVNARSASRWDATDSACFENIGFRVVAE